MSLADKLRGLTPRAWVRRPELLLANNTVKPLHGVVPRLILGQAWWDTTRRAAYASTGWHCAACGVHKREAAERPFLEGHEVYSTDYAAGRSVYVETVPLCHYCHCAIHDGRLEAMVAKGEVTKEKYAAVMEHRRRVLRAAGLPLFRTPPMAKLAPWEEWRLVIDGREYPPLYPTYEAWRAAFGADWRTRAEE